MELYLFVLREGKNIFLARQFSARPRLLARRSHGFHTRPIVVYIKMGLDARKPDFGAFVQLVNLLRVNFS